ncbi:MAG TPA: ThuA domain-containing protein [Polyangia bacterium]|nr:ThuA domain-containing protein [Polyangia bacterium]
MTSVILSALLLVAIDPYDQSGVPIEADTTNPKLAKIVLVAGTPSHPPGAHEYLATQAVLKGLLDQNPGVFVSIVRDSWPKNPKIFEKARAIVWYTDGAKNHPLLQADKFQVLKGYIDKGTGFVALHYALNMTKELGEKMLPWLGGVFDPEISGGTGAIKWTPVFKSLPSHAITRGVVPFTINDEWYFNMRFVPGMKGVTPILAGAPPEELRKNEDTKKHPGRPEVLAWTYERANGGRSFAITTPHSHEDWADENLRRLVVNGILWTAKVEVPKAGAKVALNPVDLKRNLDDKRPKAAEAKPTAPTPKSP